MVIDMKNKLAWLLEHEPGVLEVSPLFLCGSC
jgi:hypothetical protein